MHSCCNKAFSYWKGYICKVPISIWLALINNGIEWCTVEARWDTQKGFLWEIQKNVLPLSLACQQNKLHKLYKGTGAEKQHFCIKWCLWGVLISRFSREQKVLNFTGDKDEREKLKDSIRKLVKLQVDQLIWLIFLSEKIIHNLQLYVIIYLDYKFIKYI